MIRSMTGYGKAEAGLKNGKLTIEIRTLNGKTADINLKSQLLPRDRELEVRARIASRLVRGTIDVYLGWEADSSESARRINADLARAYVKDVGPLAAEMGLGPGITSESVIAQAILLGSVLRIPDLLEAKKAEVIGEDEWESVTEITQKWARYEYRDKGGVGSFKVYDTKEEALKDAGEEWRNLTQRDKDSYIKDSAGSFYVGLFNACVDESGDWLIGADPIEVAMDYLEG